MSLIFFKNKNNKPDNRMVEYDQAVVRLGLEKAEAERKLGIVQRELIDIENRKIEVLFEIEKKVREVSVWESKADEARKQVEEVVRKGADDVARVRENRKKTESLVDEKQEELEKLSLYLVSLGNEIETKNKAIFEIHNKSVLAREEFVRLQGQVAPLRRELEELQKDIEKLRSLRSKLEDELEVLVLDRRDTQEVVNMLKLNNKEGLALVSSFEGERKRLQEKDKFLIRKEKDLKKYEERLEKSRIDAGNNNPMVFK